VEGRTILVRHAASGPWVEPESSTYNDEKHLQELLAADPTRIPGIPPGSKAVRELQTSSGPVDICIVSPSGAITIVECKLQKSSEPRRMVIGQVIDYASALRSDGYATFRQNWLARDGDDFDQIVEDGEVKALEKNLSNGIIHLCLAVDQIDEDLKRLVEYLYLISNDEISVSALQLTYARHGSLEILIPSTYGTEIGEAKASIRSAASEHWTWESFVSALNNEVDRTFAADLKNRLDTTPSTGSYPKLWLGARPKGGVFFHIHGERYAPFQLWINATGRLVLSANWSWWTKLKNDERFADLARFLGQDHRQSTRRVLVADLNISEFWKVASECDRNINQRDGE